MKAVKIIILLAVIGAAAGIVVWRMSYCTPRVGVADDGLQRNVARQPSGAAEANNPGEGEQERAPEPEQEKPEQASGGDEEQGGEKEETGKAVSAAAPNEPNEPNDPLENINVKDLEMKNVIQKLAEWTGKVIIPCDEVMGQKISIYSPTKVRRSRALALMFAALRNKGFVAEHMDDTIFLKPVAKTKLLSVPTIPPEVPLASVANRQQVVQKFFQLQNYSASQMAQFIVPLVDEHGYVSADDSTGKLLVIDTVENLIRISRVVAQFDVPEAEQAVTDIIEVNEGDPGEIVQILQLLFGAESNGKVPSPPRHKDRSRGVNRSGEKKAEQGGSAVSVVAGTTGSRVVLIPEAKRKRIIAMASPTDMKKIREWIEKLDYRETVAPEYETIQIKYASVREVADQISRMLQEMPGSAITPSVLVQPLEQAGQIILYGRKDLREVIKKLIETIDIPTGKYIQETFELEHADPDQIKKNIEALYGEFTGRDPYMQYLRARYGLQEEETVKVISFPTMKQVTVIATPNTMEKIEKQIEEWDVAIDPNDVKPLVLTLHNTDPVKMAKLLNKLFSEEDVGFFERYIEARYGTSLRKMVGPLYGQLVFEDVPGTKRLVVISKMPEAYKVIESFVRELDEEEMAEVPSVVTLKYADAEDLAFRLNAIFNEPGTTAKILLSKTGLSEYSMQAEENNKSGGTTSNKGQTSVREYTPWWSGARRRQDELPISNVIGRIRFIPEPHSKSILVLSPPEYIDRVREMIMELDVPGRQVRIKAVVLEVDHRDLTSLGVQLAAHPDVFGSLDEDSITILSNLSVLEERGSLRLEANANINALVDFLVKKVNAKVLNQQTLWTKDNEEADFFKGQRVPFFAGATLSAETGSTRQDFTFERVGMALRVRPSITPEKNVDVTINLIISQLTAEEINGQPIRTEMDTETTMIVKDGETVLLGGMLFQEDSSIRRKVPLLGDIPFLGGLFRHSELVKANDEVLVFITPYVVEEDPEKMLPETRQQLKQEKERLKTVLSELGASVGGD